MVHKKYCKSGKLKKMKVFNNGISLPRPIIVLSLIVYYIVLFFIPWGISYFSLRWLQHHNIIIFMIAIVFNFILLFTGLWMTKEKIYFREYSPDDYNEEAEFQKHSKGTSIYFEMQLLLSLIWILGFAGICINCFGALTSVLNSLHFLKLNPGETYSFESFVVYYFWQFLDFIPQLKVVETLHYKPLFNYIDNLTGIIIILFKIVMLSGIITGINKWIKWRKNCKEKLLIFINNKTDSEKNNPSDA